ncbi:PIN domain-containing protein [Sinomicrobium kalidii]|uniref:type II toxin-antitoxin system VapC family toxin n=1 Tax=Sinomicrobium kalidii TaxID=2900738 RepID=UPI001E5E1DC8|nr:PIN domain-containing protein [Sinomicrobium kalidii]UGU16046.1 PIN domain-containing protein [Sinomicrobium kalidii]
MKVFLDANILVSVLNKEYPLFSYSSRLLSLADSKRFKLFTSPVCLAIAFYFAEKKSGRKMARQKIRMLISKIHIAEADRKAVVLAAEHKAVEHFEDGLEYYAALNAGCQCIVTENTGDFYFSEIEVLQPHQFLEQHVIKHL